VTAHSFSPIRRRGRVSTEIVTNLKQHIAGGKLKAGDRLPAERDLADQFEVSRSSVREALHTLEMTGLIESRQGGGTFVREASIDTIKEPLSSLLVTQPGAITDILDARRMIEPPLAQRASQRATPEQISALSRALEDQERAVATGQSSVDEDSRFHHLLAEATGNRVIVALVEALMEILYISRERYLQSSDRAHISLRGHRRILDAIAAHHPEAAYKAMLEHLEDVEHVIAATAPDAGRSGTPNRNQETQGGTR